MAKQHICDGTGEPIPEDTPATGHFGRQYSEVARIDAEAYLRELDELHTKHATAFSDDLGALRTKYHERLKTLPDDA